MNEFTLSTLLKKAVVRPCRGGFAAWIEDGGAFASADGETPALALAELRECVAKNLALVLGCLAAAEAARPKARGHGVQGGLPL